MPILQSKLDQLTQINAEINGIPYVSLPKVGEGYDVWKDQPDGGTWECRDYVLVKKERLEGIGYANSDLSVVLCYTETNEYHAVLAVEGGGETWIMDSRVQPVYRWDQPPYPYRWVWRQVAGTDQFNDISGA
jgi:predicted transglutaminase-like cysteine proteinase